MTSISVWPAASPDRAATWFILLLLYWKICVSPKWQINKNINEPRKFCLPLHLILNIKRRETVYFPLYFSWTMIPQRRVFISCPVSSKEWERRRDLPKAMLGDIIRIRIPVPASLSSDSCSSSHVWRRPGCLSCLLHVFFVFFFDCFPCAQCYWLYRNEQDVMESKESRSSRVSSLHWTIAVQHGEGRHEGV